jgi:hypothetical protein
MKRLHIVEPYHSKAMQAMAQPLIDALPAIYEVTTGGTPDPSADLNYHIPWHTLTGLEKGNGKHAMLYTHCNPGAQADLTDACERADLIICMSFAGRLELIGLGVDRAKLWVIYPSRYLRLRATQRTQAQPHPDRSGLENGLLPVSFHYFGRWLGRRSFENA